MMSKMDQIRVKGWRAGSKVSVESVLMRNSEVGQLLFYLVVLQLHRIKLPMAHQVRL